MLLVEICSNCGVKNDGNECYCSICGGTFIEVEDCVLEPITSRWEILKYDIMYEFGLIE